MVDSSLSYGSTNSTISLEPHASPPCAAPVLVPSCAIQTTEPCHTPQSTSSTTTITEDGSTKWSVDGQTEGEGESQSSSSTSIIGIVYISLGAFSFSVMFLLVKLMKDTNTFTLVYYRSWVQILLALLSLSHSWRQKQKQRQSRQETAMAWGRNWYHSIDRDAETGDGHPKHEQFKENNTTSSGDNKNIDDDIWSFFLGAPSVRGWLAWRGISGATAVCAFFFGIQLLPLPDAVTLQFTTPPFAAAFAVCLVGEPWLPLDKVGAVICLLGVVLIAHPTVLFGTDDNDSDYSNKDDEDPASVWLQTLAVLVCTGGAALAGMAYVTVRKIGNRASAAVMVLYYGVLSLPLTVLGSALWEGTFRVWTKPEGLSFTLQEWCFLFLMGIAGYGGQWLTNLGLQRETAAKATLATSTQIVWTYIFELTLLHESLEGWSLAGTGLILGYMLLVAFFKFMEQQKIRQQQERQNHPNNDEEEEQEQMLCNRGDYEDTVPQYDTENRRDEKAHLLA